jgi:type I restriction enzyme M protein
MNTLREANPAKKPSFDAIVANPPFSYRWEPSEAMAQDGRFKSYGLAPKSAADFAFLLHGLHYLKEQGTMAIILPHGVLFRGGAEERIRQKLLDDGHIDTVIGLPAAAVAVVEVPVISEPRAAVFAGNISLSPPSIGGRPSERRTSFGVKMPVKTPRRAAL